MPQKTLAVANYFIERGIAEGVAIDPLKLQKLIYFAHGWHLAVTGEPLIDECVEAWPYGPVVPTVYHEFKGYGNSPITAPAMVPDEGFWTAPRVTDPAALAVLGKVWKEYSRFSGVYLSNISHEVDSPWEVAWRRAKASGKVRGVDISDGEIRRFFSDAGLRNRSRRWAS